MQEFATDVGVSLQEDRPGMLARALEAISRAQVNVDGYAEIEGFLHVLTRDAAAARRALEAAGFLVREQAVLVVDVENRPGVAAGVFRRIADAGVNVSFSYVAANNRLVIAAGDLRKVADLRLTGSA